MALQFVHPHIETIINDNSFILDEVVSNGTALYQPFLSDRGVDNEIRRYTSVGELIKEHGNPVFKRHGQSIYNAINWLKAGGVVYGTRLMPDDATYSNLVINIKTKEEDDKLKIATEILTLDNVLDKDSLLTKMNDLVLFPTVGEDGYKNNPIFGLVAPGKGAYGNQYSVRMNYNNSYRDTYNFRTYNFTILSKDERGLVREVDGPFVVSTYPEAKSISGTSMFLKNILETFGSTLIPVFDEAKYDALLDTIAPFCPEGVLPHEIDFLFGRDGNLEQYEKIVLDSSVTDGSIEKFEGASLAKGTEGSFETRNPNRQTAIEQMLNDVYLGIKLPELTNKRAFPIDVLLDANYPQSVKGNMVNLAENLRQDCIAILDTNLIKSTAELLNWRNEEFNISSFYAAIYGQNFIVEDQYTNSDIPVTATYFLAGLIPSIDKQYGIHYPIAGPQRGVLTGFKKGSLSCNPSTYEQEDLYISRINYIVQDYNSTEICSNNTSQKRTSALTSINNVRTLFKIIRSIENTSRNFTFSHADSNTLTLFSQTLSTIANEWVNNGACSSLNLTPYQSNYDKEQKICRVKVDIEFTGTIERIVIEVNVGK